MRYKWMRRIGRGFVESIGMEGIHTICQFVRGKRQKRRGKRQQSDVSYFEGDEYI